MQILFQNFSFGYSRNSLVLNNINLSIRKGEKILLTGPTGSGKTTLLYVIAGFVPRFIPGYHSGKAEVMNINCVNGFEKLRTLIGFVLQDFENQLLGLTVEEEIALGLHNLGLEKRSLEKKLKESLNIFSLERIRTKYSFNISFGEKQRVVLASILSMNPKIILLDEPFSQLDDKAKENLVNILKKCLNDEQTLIIAEHEIERVMSIASRIIILDSGRIIYDGEASCRDLFENYGLLANILSRKSFSIGNRVVLQAKNLMCGWYKKAIIHLSEFKIKEKEIVGVSGPNGSGKTTLLLTLGGYLPYLSGEILRLGRSVLVYQNPDNNILYTTVWEEVFKAANNFMKSDDATEWAEELLEIFSLKKYKEKSPWKLSRGERTKLAIASALATRPKILMLDEPTYGLDYRSIKILLEILYQLVDELSLSVIVASHRKGFLERVCDRLYGIINGELKEYGEGG